jgi:hypothetical protein
MPSTQPSSSPTEKPTFAPSPTPTATNTTDEQTFVFVDLRMTLEGGGDLSTAGRTAFANSMRDFYRSAYDTTRRRNTLRRDLQSIGAGDLSSFDTVVVVTNDAPTDDDSSVTVTYQQNVTLVGANGPIDEDLQYSVIEEPLSSNTEKANLIALLQLASSEFENVTSLTTDFPWNDNDDDDDDDSIAIWLLVLIIVAGLVCCCCIFGLVVGGVLGKTCSCPKFGRRGSTNLKDDAKDEGADPFMGTPGDYDGRPIDNDTFKDEGDGAQPDKNNDSFADNYHMSSFGKEGEEAKDQEVDEDESSEEEDDKEGFEDEDDSSSDEEEGSSDSEDEDGDGDESDDDEEEDEGEEASSDSEDVEGGFS